MGESTSLVRTYRYRLYPTRRQEDLLRQMLRDHCDLYNAALQERREAWAHGDRVTYYDQQSQISDIRSVDLDGLDRWDVTTLRQTLKRLDLAFAAFFRRVKAGQTPGYPRFRAWRRFDSVTCVIGNGSAWKDNRLRLFGVGEMKVRVHREWRGTPKIAHVTRSGKKWYVALVCEGVPRQIRELTGVEVGIDRGVNWLMVDSNGGSVANPRFYRAAQEKLTKAQRGLARKAERKSRSRRRAVERVAGVHRRIAAQRKDYLHKVSRRYVDACDLVVLEKLNTAGMTRRAHPRPREGKPGEWEPNGGSRKTGLNKSILDAGWGMLELMLRYKAEEAGTEVLSVPAANTSRRCFACGHTASGNRRRTRFRCLACWHEDHADVNAAKNILRAGYALRPAMLEQEVQLWA